MKGTRKGCPYRTYVRLVDYHCSWIMSWLASMVNT